MQRRERKTVTLCCFRWFVRSHGDIAIDSWQRQTVGQSRSMAPSRKSPLPFGRARAALGALFGVGEQRAACKRRPPSPRVERRPAAARRPASADLLPASQEPNLNQTSAQTMSFPTSSRKPSSQTSASSSSSTSHNKPATRAASTARAGGSSRAQRLVAASQRTFAVNEMGPELHRGRLDNDALVSRRALRFFKKK